jgi:sugar-specific transcriptional regulator TrmB
MNNIAPFLIKQFGLSAGEASIYLELLSLQSATVLDLSKTTKINRITVHGYINKLIEIGLVTQTKKGSRRILIAESPDVLTSLLNQKKTQLEQAESQLPSIINSIYQDVPKAKEQSEVGIKYYEGKKAVGLIYQEAVQANEIRSYVNIKEISRVFPNNINLFLDAHKQREKMEMWEIIEGSSESDEYNNTMHPSRYHIKQIPKDAGLTDVDYMMFDGKVAVVNLQQEVSGFVITNKYYYQNSVAIFKFIWKMLP